MSQSSDEEWLLEQHIRIAQMLANMFHPLVEALVQDYRPKKRGIRAIFGGQITGRRKGDPLTDLSKSRLRGKPVPDSLVGYHSLSSSGKELKSASLAIRSRSGKLIGALCLNFDLSLILQVERFIKLLTQAPAELPLTKPERYRSNAPKDEVAAALKELINERGLTAQQLNQHERTALVQELAKRGFFSRRGAVTVVAKALRLTRPTIYRYLK